MARKIKDKYIGGRVTQDVFDAVTRYHNASDMTQGDLVRAAVDEYMANHPLKTPRTSSKAVLSGFPGDLDGMEVNLTTGE